MNWIDRYQLFLFDFDGLLVNTEELHYAAYRQMMAARGVKLTWTFERYCQSAHYATENFRKELFHDYPELAAQDPTWNALYAEKQRAMQGLINAGQVDMMPGALELLSTLQEKGLAHVVVTHSPDELVSLLRAQHAVLERIPYWITRHDYTHPKPDPECYELAIARYAKPEDRIIGFEDSPRGLKALLETRADPILICNVKYPEIPEFISRGVKHFTSLAKVHLHN